MAHRFLSILLPLVLGGCGGPPVYLMRTNAPWPDQWTTGPRQPQRTELALTLPTVTWHRQADMTGLRRQIEQMASRHHGALVMTRPSFADRRAQAHNPKHALAFLEVRVTAWPLPASPDSGACDWDFADLPLQQAVLRCARQMNATVTLSEAIAPSTPVDFSVPHTGPAEALALLLLRHDLYLAPTCLGTIVLRSYEYGSAERFLQAVRRQLRQADHAQPTGPYTVVTLPRWTELHQDALYRMDPQMGPSSGDPARDRDRLVTYARRHLYRMLELRLRERTPAEPAE